MDTPGRKASPVPCPHSRHGRWCPVSPPPPATAASGVSGQFRATRELFPALGPQPRVRARGKKVSRPREKKQKEKGKMTLKCDGSHGGPHRCLPRQDRGFVEAGALRARALRARAAGPRVDLDGRGAGRLRGGRAEPRPVPSQGLVAQLCPGSQGTSPNDLGSRPGLDPGHRLRQAARPAGDTARRQAAVSSVVRKEQKQIGFVTL
ncbi:uncharacterized protein LOC107510184 [Rousettus aegyptiacus]|uniref:uncharacterized protein LOC107510184 n=1 Tax=Rousettus aegyptiacus TaxID=9407 RepID=UPI00168D69E8|nr:uncharacterized protein LOC107510184 [Rousettus aegyptiacus]